jgi:hypothetical protein
MCIFSCSEILPSHANFVPSNARWEVFNVCVHEKIVCKGNEKNS